MGIIVSMNRYFGLYKFKDIELIIVQDGDAVSGIYAAGDEVVKEENYTETELIKTVKEQLDEYFTGQRQVFDFPVVTSGTEFQKRVWEELKQIPYGETISYSELAERCGSSKACRAVGQANNRNKLMIIIPCHRVVGKNGDLTGSAGGLAVKKLLLELEKKYS